MKVTSADRHGCLHRHGQVRQVPGHEPAQGPRSELSSLRLGGSHVWCLENVFKLSLDSVFQSIAMATRHLMIEDLSSEQHKHDCCAIKKE